MIELSEEQHKAVTSNPGQPLRLVDPATQQAFVLLTATDYERLRREAYDASPWTDEEMDFLAGEDADRLGWQGMDMYQDPARDCSSLVHEAYSARPTIYRGGCDVQARLLLQPHS